MATKRMYINSNASLFGRVGASRIVGFTLIELMLVVLIVAVLAALAIPMYQAYQVRSKVSGKIRSVSANITKSDISLTAVDWMEYQSPFGSAIVGSPTSMDTDETKKVFLVLDSNRKVRKSRLRCLTDIRNTMNPLRSLIE